jgi:hydroxymethylpyrimidine pyrophosphatase-like HAD family hydrolase
MLPLRRQPEPTMRYVALAAGYDGTLAQDGRCDERCVDALRALSATGRKLILVTARELRELLEIFPEARIFDYVVAENGAVMHRSATRQSEILAQAPPEILLQELRRRHITPLSVGSSIVRTVHAHEREINDALRKLQLDFQLVTNPGALMMLPAGVNKASGVRAALKDLGVSRHNMVAIGDGENDLALFEYAEQAVAVQNADPLVKRVADRTTQGAFCDGFLELAHDLIATDLATAVPRRKILLGLGADLQEVGFVPCRDSLLLHGPQGSGKTAICNRLLEQLLVEGYQCCMIGASLGTTYPAPPDVTVFGDSHEVPRLTDILGALEQPTASVAINLAALAVETRPVFIDALLVQLQALHDRLGRPHALFIHQAHTFLAGATSAAVTRLSEVSMIYATSEPERLSPSVLQGVRLVVDSATQAITAGGVVGRMSVFRPVSAGKESPSPSDTATLSGY